MERVREIVVSRVLILGIGGQDGSYLAEHLLAQGVEVHGLVRRSSVDNLVRIRSCVDRVTLHRGDLGPGGDSLRRVVDKVRPQTIYNLADQDVVSWSHDTPSYSVDVTYGGASRVFEVVNAVDKTIRVFQPCSATVFGSGHSGPCDEETPFRPESPYACAKAGAYYLAQHYRREHGVFVSTAFLYGHNSPRQKCEYLLHRIARKAVEVAAGKRSRIVVRDPHFLFDVGHAREFVEGMVKLMALSEPTDVVMATGKPVSLADLVLHANYEAGVPPNFFTTWEYEVGKVSSVMAGDITKMKSLTGWDPTLNAEDVVTELVEHYRKEIA